MFLHPWFEHVTEIPDGGKISSWVKSTFYWKRSRMKCVKLNTFMNQKL